MDLSLVILGFGGHARSVADVALFGGWRIASFVDENAQEGESFAGAPVLDSLCQTPTDCLMISASGDNVRRQMQCEQVSGKLATLVAPSASRGALSEIGEGTFIGRMAHIGPQACVGRGVILNTGCIVEHECLVGDFTHVSVNATVAGRCTLGKRVMIGAGATVIDGVTICDDAVIGAGAVVVDHITVPGTYVGVPAKLVESGNKSLFRP